MRILIAEDDAVSRRILVAAMSRHGHACHAFADGEEAWQVHAREPADVVVSDWLMPGLEGIELCRRVRAHDVSHYTYFILITSLTDKQHFRAAMEAGADDFLTKPFDMDEIQVRLIAAQRVTSLHKELAEQRAELERLGRASHEAARTDALTGVGNRLRMREDLDDLLARHARYGHRACLALADVDHFKRYNDRYGHLAGDRALATVAEALRAGLRQGDAVYRYGGEEFLLVLAGQDAAGATAAMDRIRDGIEALAVPHEARPGPPVLTISVGVADLPADADVEAWIRRADDALYRAKQAGRNRVEQA